MNSTGHRIAVVTMGVKLGDETCGYTRFHFLSELLVREGFEVDLITSSFQHWEKAQRDCGRACYHNLPYRVVFIDEPGYKKNLDLKRIRSHAVAAKNLRVYLAAHSHDYELIYAEIPPNDIARVCAEHARKIDIPFVADINDLWPEAMRMVFDIPIIREIAFYPFSRDAHRAYALLSGAVGTSDEYSLRPSFDRKTPYVRETVYVGNDITEFDAGVAAFQASIEKPSDEIWVTYTGTLGASYDIATLIEAGSLIRNDAAFRKNSRRIRIKILGDGPDRSSLEILAQELSAPVDFLGYQDYAFMAAYLDASDMTINSLVKTAAQSIVTKIGDYLASGKPMINTGSSTEFCKKVVDDGFGINVEAENSEKLARSIVELADDPDRRKIMGAKARTIAESQFDQAKSYMRIVDMVTDLIERPSAPK